MQLPNDLNLRSHRGTGRGANFSLEFLAATPCHDNTQVSNLNGHWTSLVDRQCDALQEISQLVAEPNGSTYCTMSHDGDDSSGSFLQLETISSESHLFMELSNNSHH